MNGKWLALGFVAALAMVSGPEGSASYWGEPWWKSGRYRLLRVGGSSARIFGVGNRWVLAFERDLEDPRYDGEKRWTFQIREGKVVNLHPSRTMRSSYHLVYNHRDSIDPWTEIENEVQRSLQRDYNFSLRQDEE